MSQRSLSASKIINSQNLAGHRLATIYWAELAHQQQLEKQFPVQATDVDDMFVCTDLIVLKRIVSMLPRRKFKVFKRLAIINEPEAYAFELTAMADEHSYGRKSESLRIINGKDLETMNSPAHFGWKAGLNPAKGDHMSPTDFEAAFKDVMRNP